MTACELTHIDSIKRRRESQKLLYNQRTVGFRDAQIYKYDPVHNPKYEGGSLNRLICFPLQYSLSY